MKLISSLILASTISTQIQAKEQINPLDYSLKVEWSVPTISGIPQQGHGTGFIIDKVRGLVMTAAHVIPSVLPGLKPGALLVEGSPAQLVCMDGEHDLALLKVSDIPQKKKIPNISKDYSPKVGDTYESALENDKGMSFEIQHEQSGAYLQVPMILSSRGAIISVSNAVKMNLDGNKTPTKTEILITDKPSKPGFSGGPALDPSGKLVGVQIRVDTSFGVLSSVMNVKNLLKNPSCKVD